jgi:DNA-binding YbaB/EbfC family protein
MNELMRQASRMQRKIEKRREELALLEFEAGAGNDQVKAVASGNAEIVRLTIDPALLKEEGLEMVQDLVVAACNAALAKAREHVDGELEQVTGGLKIPGMT